MGGWNSAARHMVGVPGHVALPKGTWGRLDIPAKYAGVAASHWMSGLAAALLRTLPAAKVRGQPCPRRRSHLCWRDLPFGGTLAACKCPLPDA